MLLSNLSVYSAWRFFCSADVFEGVKEWVLRCQANNEVLEGKKHCWLMRQDACSRLEPSENMCFPAAFYFWDYAKIDFAGCFYFPSVWQSLLQGIRILLCQTFPQLHHGLAGWMDLLQARESCRWGFQEQDYLECNEKKFVLASNQRFQLSLKKHYRIFFLSWSISHSREY